MRFSIWPIAAQPWSDIVAVVRHAEATGWDRAYVYDHFMAPDDSADAEALAPTLEATALVPALATATARIGLATLVFSVTYRHPAVLAKWAATADHVSGGRLVLGVGAGWQENEHAQYGIELGSRGERIDRFVEALEVLRGLLTERETTHAGDHYRLDRAVAEPKPLQERLPILIGGKGDRMMGVVARYADEWNMWGLPAAIAERRAALDAACDRIGRDPADIATSTQAAWFIADEPGAAAAEADPVRPEISGSIDELAEVVDAWRAAGVDEVIVPDITLGTGSQRTDRMDAIIERIAPAFR